jgi:hypothetical protein
MDFRVPQSDLTFDISDEHRTFAEMEGFSPKYSNCYSLPSQCATEEIDFSIVQISAIEPPTQRFATAPALVKARIVPILLAISSGRPLPPVQLKSIEDGRYQLVHGFHRYCASIAARFENIPLCSTKSGGRNPTEAG